jgi:hypothetical protein
MSGLVVIYDSRLCLHHLYHFVTFITCAYRRYHWKAERFDKLTANGMIRCAIGEMDVPILKLTARSPFRQSEYQGLSPFLSCTAMDCC